MRIIEQNHKIFGVDSPHFEGMALDVFRFQYDHNPVYKRYADMLGVRPDMVRNIEQIPFLPIRFFKSLDIRTGLFEPQVVFESSGTTGSVNSRHEVKDLSLYEESFTRGFEFFYGPVNEYCVIGLLPAYLERKNSSLVYMVEKLIHRSEHPQSGFYLYEYEKLSIVLKELEKRKQKTLVIGVTFAWLDFAEKFSLDLQHTIIMETGGMKGRREEMIRPEVHRLLKEAFHVPVIHSEYGMTELLSQAYSKGEGIFHCPPWMKVLIRDDEDPLEVRSVVSRESSGVSRESAVVSRESSVVSSGSERGSATHDSRLPTDDSRLSTLSGALNIIDLANIYSCSFIATDDVGKIYSDGSFEVLGRMDGSDLRGCSLMLV